MGLFNTPPPKRVTEKELEGTAFTSGLYGRLRSGDYKLNDTQFERFKEIASGYIKSKDYSYSHPEAAHGLREDEITSLVQALKESKRYTSGQVAHIDKTLRKGL